MVAFRIPNRIPGQLSELSAVMALVNADDKNKNDILVRGSQMEFTNRKTLALPTKDGTKEFSFTPYSFDQFAGMLKIPAKYLETCPVTGKGGMKDQVESRMEKKLANDFLVRVRMSAQEAEGVSGFCRAILPGNFTPFDNRHMVDALTRAMREAGGKFKLTSSNTNDPKSLEEHMHLRLIHEGDTSFEIEGGMNDQHKMGFHAITSEVGACKLEIDALVYRLVCKNGMMGWADSEVLKVPYRNFQAHEMFPRVNEAVLSSIRQGEVIRDLLNRSYGEEFGDSPEAYLAGMGRRMRVSDHVLEQAVETFRRERYAHTRFFAAQAFTFAAQTLPIRERIELEDAVGRELFGVGRRRRRRTNGNTIDTTAEEN